MLCLQFGGEEGGACREWMSRVGVKYWESLDDRYKQMRTCARRRLFRSFFNWIGRIKESEGWKRRVSEFVIIIVVVLET